MQFEPVGILDPDLPLNDQIADFVNSEALAALRREFGIDTPRGSLHEQLARLWDASEVWNYRQGKERNFMEQTGWESDRTDLVRAAASAFGLVDGGRPALRSYDEVLILGGLVRACFSRPAEAARLIDDGSVNVHRVTALCGFRPLGGNEFHLAESLGFSGLTDEFDAMEAGVRQAFAISNDPVSDEGAESVLVGGSWRTRRLRDQPEPMVRVAAAPSSEPETRRANTADTYQWFGGRLSVLGPDSSLLLITSAIYVPYQHADALRMLTLPYGARVETIGVATEKLVGPLQQTFSAQHYLQEVRSMIRAYKMLLEVLDQPTR